MNPYYRLCSGVGLCLLMFAPLAEAQPKRALMRDAHALVFDHTSVTRSVEKLPNGVRTTTTTVNPEMLPVLRKHPREMGTLYQQGGMVRGWDPLFRELAAVSEKVKMEVRDIEGGVEVLSTSEDPEVVKLIQAHADKVSEMVKRGVPAMQEATEIPPGYTRPGADGLGVSPAPAPEPLSWDGTLVQFGTMREAIGERQSQGRVSLVDVQARPHFYGLGALEDLVGEVTFIDGEATASRVGGSGTPVPHVAAPATTKATLLVGAYVPQWREQTLAKNVAPDGVDQFILDAATKAGLDAEKPFIFWIEGEFIDARLHIINGVCPVHARRSQGEIPKEQRPFETTLPKVSGAIVGIFAKDSVGTLTHPGTSVHMHLRYVDETSGAALTGHLEQVGLAAGCVLRLP